MILDTSEGAVIGAGQVITNCHVAQGIKQNPA